MTRTRIILGVVVTLLGWLVLLLLWVVRYDYKWNQLGVWYHRAMKEADIDLPLMIRLLWPFSPAAWWGWISPIAFGVFAAAKVRRPLGLPVLIGTLVGTVFLVSVVYSTIVTYTRMTFYLGYPQPEPIELSCLLGNAGLLLLGVLLAIHEFLRGEGPSRAPGQA